MPESSLVQQIPAESAAGPNSGSGEGIALFNTALTDKRPSDYTENHHVHILCHRGEARFRCNGREAEIHPDDLVIWQQSSDIDAVVYSDDFVADFLVVSVEFLARYNPEMTWAAKGFIYIKLHPVFHLLPEEYDRCMADFKQFRERMAEQNLFRTDIQGRLLQIFLFDMWDIYSREMDKMKFSNNTARIFLNFLDCVEQHCKTQREAAYYASELCITPKYLSDVCRKVSEVSALDWIKYYTIHELTKVLKDFSLTIAEASDSMNFKSPSHFSRMVRELLGVSPSEYRHSIRDNE